MADPELMGRMAPLIERFTALCDTYGVGMLSEGGTFEAFKNQQLPVEALSGRRVLELPEGWAFKTDPDNVGESQGWFKRPPDDSWKPISILQAWEPQGYDRYDGYAWYTVEVDVPEIEAKTVWLLCGAVDETFDLWINGQPAGERKGNPQSIWDKPAAIDVTGKLVPGRENRITMRVHDVGYAGGIWKPIWITASP